MNISNENIALRALEPDDVELLYKWENNAETWKVSNSHIPISKFMLANYIKSSDRDIWESKELRLLVEDQAGKPIGTIELFDFDAYHNRAGLGLIIFEKEDRRKGFATETIQLICDYAKNDIGIFQLYVNIAETNLPSIALFEGQGFELIGVKKKWLRTPNGWESEFFYQKEL